MKPIYIPKGRAKEYGDYAINIYTGCPHECYYCFAPNVLHRKKEMFHQCVQPRDGIVEDVKKQLERGDIRDKLIHLCFTCDPYPTGCDTSATREIIQAIKDSGNHVQILTKGSGHRDLDLLDENDWYGVSFSCDTGMALQAEPFSLNPQVRLNTLAMARQRGIKTWVSFEPVLDPEAVILCIRLYHHLFDKVKIGKLNYHPSAINWKDFGERVERLCREVGLDYYIKESLRMEMEG